MSLSDAKRLLQWRVVTEALEAADVGSDVIEMVDRARAVEETVHSMASVLIGVADVQQAKNYVKVDMVGMLSPFDRAYVELARPGGRTSHELRELLRDRLACVRRALSQGVSSGETLEAIIADIDRDLAAEAP